MKSYEYGPVEQLCIAVRNPLALVLGGLFGAFAPIASYFVSHQDWHTKHWLRIVGECVLVLGALVFSAKTVWQWGEVFWGREKATGFVILTELVLVLSPSEWLSLTALCILVAINTIANGYTAAMRDREDKAWKALEAAQQIANAPLALSPVATPVAPSQSDLAADPSRSKPARNTLPAQRKPTSALPDAAQYAHARELVLTGTCDSTSSLQRELRVGYNKAARFAAQLKREGLLGGADGHQPPALPFVAA